MNGPSGANISKTELEPARSDASASSPNEKPSAPLPASPMKTRAGGQFQRRNPTADAVMEAATRESPHASDRTRAVIAKAPASAAVIPARPSIPSMKL